jgi:hypothetical protein
MWLLSCAENGFAEKELAGESRKNVRTGAEELKEELYSVRIVFMWMNQQERNLRNISILVKERCNVVEKQNMFVKLSKGVQ